MKIVATADLHYEMEQSRAEVRALAQEVASSGADALMILGDTFAYDEEILHECLALFSSFEGGKLLCAGNHDLWTRDDGTDARTIIEDVMRPIAKTHGFHLLDIEPAVIDGVGFVGGCGWYDYQLRDESLGVPLPFYRLKMGPGAVNRMDPQHQLDLPWDDLTPAHYRIGTMWNDGVFVKWRADDEDVTTRLVGKLRRDIASVDGRSRAIVAGMHHIPFKEMTPRSQRPEWGFGNAFLGSPRLGEALIESPKVRIAIFGHTHLPDRKRIAHIDAINVGSTYRKKLCVEVEV